MSETKFFSLNGSLNKVVDADNIHKLPSRTNVGATVLPSDTPYPKVVYTKGKKCRGKCPLNPRVNINSEAFQTSNTHEDSRRVQPPTGPPTEPNLFVTRDQVNKTPRLTKKRTLFSKQKGRKGPKKPCCGKKKHRCSQ